MRLTDESSNVRELPAFLAVHGGVNSGFMIVQVGGCTKGRRTRTHLQGDCCVRPTCSTLPLPW